MDPSLLDDPAAVAAMAAGNPVGLESIYRRYADRIYAYARSIVGDDDTAADVIQETFLLAQERIRQLRDPARVAAWLYAIARHECLAKLRARKRTVTLAESPEPVQDTDPGRSLHAEQIRELVHAAAAGMNDGDREVFELTVRHGLSAADVARVLDVSDKHTHVMISRARSQFERATVRRVAGRRGQAAVRPAATPSRTRAMTRSRSGGGQWRRGPSSRSIARPCTDDQANISAHGRRSRGRRPAATKLSRQSVSIW